MGIFLHRYEREPQYKAVIMQKLGIAPGESQKQPAEGMAKYAEKTLAADDYEGEAPETRKPEPEVFGNMSAKVKAAILNPGSQDTGTDEEDLEAANQG
jgi:hypothetical protein